MELLLFFGHVIYCHGIDDVRNLLYVVYSKRREVGVLETLQLHALLLIFW